MDAEDQPRYDRLCLATKYFLQRQPIAEIAKAAEERPFRVLDYIERALEPWKEGTGITGTRAFVPFLVQRKRTRTAELKEQDPEDAPMAGFSGLFGKLFSDHPEIENKLKNFLNGYARPMKVSPKTILTKFQELCKSEGLTDKDYPLVCESKGFRPLMRWFKTKYLPNHLLAHIARNNGQAAAVAGGYELGDGET